MMIAFFQPTTSLGLIKAYAADENESTLVLDDSGGTAGIQYADVKEGTGAEALEFDLATIDYAGTVVGQTKPFDSAKFFRFGLGQGEVVRGFDIAVLGDGKMKPMRVGGVRVVEIQPELAYGARGAGCKKDGTECAVPPDAVLRFTIALTNIK